MAVESLNLKSRNMTTATALDGPWAGLRAFPRGFRTPDTRNRMEAALERLQHHRERFARHMARSQAAMARIDGLTSTMIDQLDAIDAPTDELEPIGDDEPSLCGVRCGILSFDNEDGEDSADDQGEPLNADLMTGPADQTGSRWIGGVSALGLEGECDDEGWDDDHEPGFGVLHV